MMASSIDIICKNAENLADSKAVLDLLKTILRKVIPNVVLGAFCLDGQILKRMSLEVAIKLKEYIDWSVVAFAVPITDDGLWVWHHHGTYRSLMANYVLDLAFLAVKQHVPKNLQVVDLPTLTEQKVSMTKVGELAGLGRRGWNNLLLHPDYGSWLQIHALLINCTLPYDEPLDYPICTHCHLCIEACPVNALDKGEFNPYRCQSVVASPWKAKSRAIALTSHTYIECRECITVCPIGEKSEGLFEWKK